MVDSLACGFAVLLVCALNPGDGLFPREGACRVRLDADYKLQRPTPASAGFTHVRTGFAHPWWLPRGCAGLPGTDVPATPVHPRAGRSVHPPATFSIHATGPFPLARAYPLLGCGCCAQWGRSRVSGPACLCGAEHSASTDLSPRVRACLPGCGYGPVGDGSLPLVRAYQDHRGTFRRDGRGGSPPRVRAY